MRLLDYVKHCPAWFWVLLSGLLLGLNAPGRHTQLVGMVSLFPYLLALERIHVRHERSWKKRVFYTCAASWGVGFVAAPIGVNWMVHCLRIFGHLSWAPSYLITSAGYGLEVAYLLFCCFGLPLFFIRRRTWWDLPVRLSFYLMMEPLLVFATQRPPGLEQKPTLFMRFVLTGAVVVFPEGVRLTVGQGCELVVVHAQERVDLATRQVHLPVPGVVGLTERGIVESMKENLSEVDAHSAEIAVKCMNRLHKRYWNLLMKGKLSNIAITAVAREFVGFIWAIMQLQPNLAANSFALCG